jgi:hypothetical protein
MRAWWEFMTQEMTSNMMGVRREGVTEAVRVLSGGEGRIRPVISAPDGW